MPETEEKPQEEKDIQEKAMDEAKKSKDKIATREQATEAKVKRDQGLSRFGVISVVDGKHKAHHTKPLTHSEAQELKKKIEKELDTKLLDGKASVSMKRLAKAKD